ncbi:hypothetical protein G7054_g8312 [Neopestalotiopsis clavispora]|nr:hypothetical protein G7054_g8312 [Neopestalotiopsis clavispora]
MGSHAQYSEVSISKYASCVSNLLLAGADPDSVDDDGRSALSWSTQPTQKSILDLLLNAGANPDVSDKKLMLPIHYAAKFGRSDKTIKALIHRTTNLSAVDEQGTSALTWSFWSADCPPTMRMLADAVSDINSGGGHYGTPLEAASRYCSSSILRMLLEKGADPNFQGGFYGSCLAAALRRTLSRFEDDILCLELLLSHGADPNKRTSDDKQALHIAANRYYQPEIFEILLKHSADVNGIYHSTEHKLDVETTPLGILCGRLVGRNAAMVLLNAGANPNCTTPDGRTPLQAACDKSGSSELAQELIAKGADIAARSVCHHDTALHAAATAARSDMIKVLLEKGADANARNRELETPLHQVCFWTLYDNPLREEEEENHFETWRGPYEEEKEKNLMESIELLLTCGQADPGLKSINGLTPLHYAIKARIWLSVETLIKHSSCDIIFEPDSKGRLPLHLAAAVGFTKALNYLIDMSNKIWCEREFQQDIERESFFQAMRDSINAVDNSGDTALHHAARHGREKFVAKLRLLGGSSLDLDIPNHKGHTALDLAKKHHHVWLVGALKGRVT